MNGNIKPINSNYSYSQTYKKYFFIKRKRVTLYLVSTETLKNCC